MQLAEVDTLEGKKFTRSLLRKANLFLFPFFIICLLCMCHDKLIFHGIREGHSLVFACVEDVACTCNWGTC